MLEFITKPVYDALYKAFLVYGVEKNLIPDFLLRRGIRFLLKTKCLTLTKFKNTEDELQAGPDNRVPFLNLT